MVLFTEVNRLRASSLLCITYLWITIWVCSHTLAHTHARAHRHTHQSVFPVYRHFSPRADYHLTACHFASVHADDWDVNTVLRQSIQMERQTDLLTWMWMIGVMIWAKLMLWHSTSTLPRRQWGKEDTDPVEETASMSQLEGGRKSHWMIFKAFISIMVQKISIWSVTKVHLNIL